MPTNHESFWTGKAYAFVGNSAKKPFPKISYGELKKQGVTVYPIDPSAETIEGDRAFKDLASLPGPVDRVVIEVPKEETKDWVERAAAAGVKDIWIHMGRDTPEALALAKEKGINARTGTCAVMYVVPGFSFHSFHKWINKLLGKY